MTTAVPLEPVEQPGEVEGERERCWECDKTLDSPLYDSDGEAWCPEHARTCEGCETPLTDSDPDNAPEAFGAYCEDCGFSCENCGSVVHREDTTTLANGCDSVCGRCLERYYAYCEGCDGWYSRDDGSCAGNSWYCDECLSANFNWCESCCEYVPMDDGCGCDDGPVHSYNYQPHPEFYRAPGENRSAKFYIGLELEIEYCDADEDEVVDIVERELPFCYLKRDGSLSHGVEIVTHPMTPAFFLDQRDTFRRVLGQLQVEGARSYSPGTCGLHVHIDRRAVSTLTLYKFLSLVYNNPALTLTVSQRKPDALNTWARLSDSGRREIVYKAKHKFSGGKYQAVCLDHDKTLEVRIFRGTLKPESFFKSVEFVLAGLRFCEDTSMSVFGGPPESTTPLFRAWVAEHRKDYPHLDKFLGARCPNHHHRTPPIAGTED